MNPTDLEVKFHEVLLHSPKPFTMYLQSPDGFIKIVYQDSWSDGLGTGGSLRVLNPKHGLSSAPASWEYLLKTLAINGIELTEFEESLGRRVDAIIMNNQRSLDKMKELFGEDYVAEVLTRKPGRSFAEELADTLRNFMVKPKTKPSFSIIKGGSDT